MEGSSAVKVFTVGKGRMYATVQSAVDAVPLGNKERIRVEIDQGRYSQPVFIPTTKNLITFAGLGNRPDDTILTWNNNASNINHPLPSVIGKGTMGCGTVIIQGDDFVAQNITFENSYSWVPGRKDTQAVAVRVTADRCAFINCRFLGWQDTIYLHRGRSYLSGCYIEGCVDFICGGGKSLLEKCNIRCKSEGWITAQQKHSPDQDSAYVLLRCTISGNGRESGYSSLGRPWGVYAKVIYAHTQMDQCIKPQGWEPWNGEKKHPYFAEYRCSGGGSDRSHRVAWSVELNDQEASQYLTHSFIEERGHPWLPPPQPSSSEEEGGGNRARTQPEIQEAWKERFLG